MYTSIPTSFIFFTLVLSSFLLAKEINGRPQKTDLLSSSQNTNDHINPGNARLPNLDNSIAPSDPDNGPGAPSFDIVLKTNSGSKKDVQTVSDLENAKLPILDNSIAPSDPDNGPGALPFDIVVKTISSSKKGVEIVFDLEIAKLPNLDSSVAPSDPCCI